MKRKTITVLLILLFTTVAVCVTCECYRDSVCVALTQGGEMTVTLPEGFITEKDELSGIDGNLSLYNIKGKLTAGGKSFPVTGYLSEAVLTTTLADYLKTAEKYKSASIYDFSTAPIEVNGVPGYVWRYKIKTEDRNDIAVRAAFFAGTNKIYTIQLAAALGSTGVGSGSDLNSSYDKKDSISRLREEALDAAFNSTVNSAVFSESVQSGKLLEAYSFRKQAFSHYTLLCRGELSGDKICRSSQEAGVLSGPSLSSRALYGR